jgi:hypothetical protein
MRTTSDMATLRDRAHIMSTRWGPTQFMVVNDDARSGDRQVNV